MGKKRIGQALGLILAVLLMGVLGGCGPGEEPVARGTPNVAVFTEQGGAKMVVASGGEIELQSGSTLDPQGTIASAGGAVTVADNAMVDGAADAVQLTVQGHATQTSDVFVVETSAGTDLMSVDTSNATFGGLVIWSSTALTVTNGQIITPAYTLYRLNAAGNVTITLAGSCTTGQPVYLINEDGATIVVAALHIYSHDGAAWSLGQHDVVAALCNDNNWYQIVEVANQPPSG